MTTKSWIYRRWVLVDGDRAWFASDCGLTGVLIEAERFTTEEDAMYWLGVNRAYHTALTPVLMEFSISTVTRHG